MSLPTHLIDEAKAALGKAGTLEAYSEMDTIIQQRMPGDMVREQVYDRIGQLLGRKMTEIMACNLDFAPDKTNPNGDVFTTRWTGKVVVMTEEQYHTLCNFVHLAERDTNLNETEVEISL